MKCLTAEGHKGGLHMVDYCEGHLITDAPVI